MREPIGFLYNLASLVDEIVVTEPWVEARRGARGCDLLAVAR